MQLDFTQTHFPCQCWHLLNGTFTVSTAEILQFTGALGHHSLAEKLVVLPRDGEAYIQWGRR